MRSISGQNLRWLCLFLAIVVKVTDITAADGTEGVFFSETELCETNPTNILPPPYNNLSNDMVCERVWNSYIIRYSVNKDSVLTVILSTLYTTGWVGIGFSKDGLMVGSSAMVGWINKHGVPRIKQYYLQGVSVDDVIPNKGELQLTNVPEAVVLHEATIYLAFQIKLEKPRALQNVLLAFGSKYPSHSLKLPPHDDRTTLKIDFSSGSSSGQVKPACQEDRRTHGLLGILGWGFFLPVGVIIARYFRHKDPLWFYLHIVFQFLGFLLTVASFATGMANYWPKDKNLQAHKVLGTFAFGQVTFQVMAFFVRPGEDSKIRKYWNWCHNWIGRLALLYGAVNIMLGIHIAEGRNVQWKFGYGFLLCATLVAVSILEAFAFLRRREGKALQPHATLQMNSIE
ncbi:hypothetical protein QQ045_009170 [Rhodiola kirilowii]